MSYSFQNLKAYTSRTVSNKLETYTPRIGEDYQLTVEFDVVGTPLGDYHVTFDLAEEFYASKVSKTKAGHHVITHSFGALPLDDDIPWEIEIDPYDMAGGADPTKSPIPLNLPEFTGDSGGVRIEITRPPRRASLATRVKGTLTPKPPDDGVEFFDPVRLAGYQQVGVVFEEGGQIDKMALLMGQPASDSWQTMISNFCSGKVSGVYNGEVKALPATAERFWPLFYWEIGHIAANDTLFKQDFVVEVRNQRVNCEKLRHVTWEQLDALDSISVFKFYKQPESIIESKHAKIAAFVQQTLGSGYRSKMSPYDAARRLFMAVVKHVTYTFPKPGEVDRRGHTAVAVLDTKLGDCGGFSILFVACARNMGVPARTACGFWVGAWPHCWAEFYLPGHGWVLCDGSGGNAWSEYGKFAYCFGNQFDLNARMAFMRGNTCKVGSYETPWLQGPAGPYLSGSASVAHSKVLTTVNEAPVARLQRVITDASGVRIRRMKIQCPCERHGGFRPALRSLSDLKFDRQTPVVP